MFSWNSIESLLRYAFVLFLVSRGCYCLSGRLIWGHLSTSIPYSNSRSWLYPIYTQLASDDPYLQVGIILNVGCSPSLLPLQNYSGIFNSGHLGGIHSYIQFKAFVACLLWGMHSSALGIHQLNETHKNVCVCGVYVPVPLAWKCTYPIATWEEWLVTGVWVIFLYPASLSLNLPCHYVGRLSHENHNALLYRNNKICDC